MHEYIGSEDGKTRMCSDGCETVPACRVRQRQQLLSIFSSLLTRNRPPSPIAIQRASMLHPPGRSTTASSVQQWREARRSQATQSETNKKRNKTFSCLLCTSDPSPVSVFFQTPISPKLTMSRWRTGPGSVHHCLSVWEHSCHPGTIWEMNENRF